MLIHTLNRLVARVAGKTPLRTVLIVPFVLQIVGTVGLVGYLSYRNGRQAVDDLAYQLIDEVDERVEQNLQHYLDVPKHINQSLAAAIRTRVLDGKNFSGLERYFAQQLQIYPTVSNVAIATEQKEFLTVEKSLTSDSLVIRVLDKSTNYAFHYYAANPQGQRIKLTKVRHDYDPHNDPSKGRPWYRAVQEAGQAIWLPVVNLSQGVDHPILTIVNFLPFDDPDGKFQGVLGASLFLPQFTSFLDSLEVGRTGQVFIIDRQGLLIASSTGETPFKPNLDSDYLKNLNPQEWRVAAQNSKNPLTQASVNLLLTHVNNLHQIDRNKKFEFDFHHNRYFLQVNPIPDKSELDWLMITVVPESDFMTQIHANTRTTILLCIVALIGSTGIGILTARWITQPIRRLNTAAKALAKGEWNKTVETRRFDEVGELAKSFNQMAAQLQQSFAKLNSLNADLAQSESKLNQILEAIPVGVAVHDITGQIIYINQISRQLLGIDAIPQAETEQLAEVYHVYRAGTEQLYPVENMPIVRSLQGERARVDDIEIRLPARTIPLGIYSTPLFDGTGKVVAAIAAFADITERKHAEKLLADYNRTLEAKVAERTAELTRANEQLQIEIIERKLLEGKLDSSTQQVRTVFESITDTVLIIDDKKSIQVIPTKAIGWYADDTNQLNARVQQFFQEDTEEIWFAKVRQVLKTQQTVNFDYSLRINNQDVWFAAKVSPLPNRSVVWVARDISERKQAEQALIESEERFQEIARTINQFFFVRSASSGQFIYVSPAYEKIWGRTCASLYQDPQSWVEAVHPDDRDLLAQSLREQFQGNSGSREYRIIQPDGSIRWIVAYISVVRDDTGQPLRFIGLAEDISDRKRAEETLRHSEQRYLAILEDQTELIVRFLPDGTVSFVNEAYCCYFGIAREQILGHHYEPLIFEEDREYVDRLIKSITAENSVVTIENRVIIAGEMRWTQWISRALFDEQSRLIEVQAVGRDISDKKLAEEALRKYELIVSATTDAISLVDRNYIYQVINQTYLNWHNKQYEEIVGYSVSEVLGAEVFERVIKEPFDQCLAGKTAHYQNWFGLAPGRRFLSVTYSPYLEVDQTISGVVVSIRDITELKQVEERLRQRNQEMQAIFAAFPDILFRLAADGTILDFKTKNYKNLHTSPETFLAKKIQDVFPTGVGEKIHAAVRQTLQTESPLSLEYSLSLPEGEQYFEARMVRLQENEVIAVTRNISDRKRTEEALRESEEQLQLALEGSGDGFWDWKIQTGELYLNPRYLEMLGYDVDELPQEFSTWDWLIHPDDKPWVMETLNAHLADSSVPYKFDYRVLTKSGEWKWITNYGKVVNRDQNGAPLRMTGTHRDVSDRKLAETELQQAVRSAEAANLAKSQFLANMSHELRTPLNGILGYAQILQRDKNCTPKQKDAVDIIYQCGMHLLTLINDILDLSKIEAGKLELYPEDFIFPPFLTTITEIFRLKAIQKSLTYTYLPLRELPTMIHADEKRLRQVLMNLLSNAVKFTDRGSLTFKVEVVHRSNQSTMNNEQITNNQQLTTNNQIRFQVEDTGIGIPSEQLEQIFLPFEQVGDISRRAEGTGLGLAITQKIVELMGGKIFVESTPGVGSKFWFDLDVPEISTPMKSTTVKSTDNIISYSGEKRKILIVDDRWENRTVLIKMLEPIGFELEQAADGKEGLEKAVECQPDLILVDLVMPVMDGYQMTRQLRQLPEFQNTIIIAISANAFAVDRQKSLESGCNDFLPKPVQSENLLEKIKSYLNVSWTYNSQNEAQSHKLGDEPSCYPQVEGAEMVIPPKEELLALYEAVNSGHVSGVRREAIRLQLFNPDHRPFATRILELAANFEYEEILKLVDRYLS